MQGFFWLVRLGGLSSLGLLVQLAFADWYYPFNGNVDFSSLSCGIGEEGNMDIVFYRETGDGYLQKVLLQVDKSCGSAEIVQVGPDLLSVHPGFMAKLPSFVTVTLDWLYFGWKKQGA